MIRTFAAVALVSLLAACGQDSASASSNAPPSAAVATDATAVFSLGRDICQGCVDGASAKLAGVAGVGQLTLNAGGKDFTAHYDSKKIQPADIAAKLVAAGEAEAKVKP